MTTLFLKVYKDTKNGHLIDGWEELTKYADISSIIDDIDDLIGSATVDVYEDREEECKDEGENEDTPLQYRCILIDKLPELENWFVREISKSINDSAVELDGLNNKAKESIFNRIGNLIDAYRLIMLKKDQLKKNDRAILQVEG